jgi:hypothetical protein
MAGSAVADGKLRVRVRVAWWLKPYIAVLSLFCWLFNAAPDWGKFDKVIDRAIKLERDRG